MKIVIQGSSSSGKSIIVKYLQKHDLANSWIVFGIDILWDVLVPPHMQKSSKRGFYYKIENNTWTIHRGDIANDTLGKFLRIIENLSSKSNVVVDDVIEDVEHLKMMILTFDKNNTFFFKLECAEKELKRRELARNNRPIGIAVSAKKNINSIQESVYDAVFDTTILDTPKITKEILEFIKHNKPNAIHQMRKNFGYSY